MFYHVRDLREAAFWLAPCWLTGWWLRHFGHFLPLLFTSLSFPSWSGEISTFWDYSWDGAGELDRLDRQIQNILDEDQDAWTAEESTSVESVTPLLSTAHLEIEAANPSPTRQSLDKPVRQKPLFARHVGNQSQLYEIFHCTQDDFQLNSDQFYEPEYANILEVLIQTILDKEAPIQVDVLARRVARAHGFKRTRKQILEVVSRIVQNKHNYYSW